jgi:hypothetical protein
MSLRTKRSNLPYLTFRIFNKFPELDYRFYRKDLDGWPEKREIVSMKQVHGDNIVCLDKCFSEKIVKNADGLITKRKNIWLKVKVADCVPIFFYESVIKMIGVVHAGWIGTLNNIAGKMITNIVRHGGRAENIVAAIGPYIHDCCYDVPSDRFLMLKNAFSGFGFKKPDFLDLGKICAYSMIKLGVPEKQIDLSKICTKCNHHKFYSFRAGNRNVNNIGIIGLI